MRHRDGRWRLSIGGASLSLWKDSALRRPSRERISQTWPSGYLAFAYAFPRRRRQPKLARRIRVAAVSIRAGSGGET